LYEEEEDPREGGLPAEYAVEDLYEEEEDPCEGGLPAEYAVEDLYEEEEASDLDRVYSKSTLLDVG